MMKALGIIGTIAMLMVAGGIFAHTFHLKTYFYEHLQNLILGLLAGCFLFALSSGVKKLFLRKTDSNILEITRQTVSYCLR